MQFLLYSNLKKTLTIMNAGPIAIQQIYQYQLIRNPTICSIQSYIFFPPNSQQMATVWKNVHHKRDIPLAA